MELCILYRALILPRWLCESCTFYRPLIFAAMTTEALTWRLSGYLKGWYKKQLVCICREKLLKESKFSMSPKSACNSWWTWAAWKTLLKMLNTQEWSFSGENCANRRWIYNLSCYVNIYYIQYDFISSVDILTIDILTKELVAGNVCCQRWLNAISHRFFSD